MLERISTRLWHNSARSEGIAIRSSATGCPNRLRAHGRWIMAGVSGRDFLQQAGGASAALTFMIANGITLPVSPLGLPIGSQMWPHRARIGTDGYDGLAAVLKDLKGIGIEIVELVSPSGEFPSPHRRQTGPEDPSTTAESRAPARTFVVSGPPCPRSSNGRTTSA